MRERVHGHQGRVILQALFVLTILLMMAPSASHAVWPFGRGGGGGTSGLDLNQGYEVNTVTTLKGKVISLDTEEGGGPALIEVRAGQEPVFIVAAPKWFWRGNGIPFRVGDDVVAQGSLAEGQDGKRYLLSRKLINQTTGKEIVLRNDDGVPAWSRLRRGQ